MFPLSPYDVHDAVDCQLDALQFGCFKLNRGFQIVHQKINSNMNLQQQTRYVLFAVVSWWASQINSYLVILTWVQKFLEEILMTTS